MCSIILSKNNNNLYPTIIAQIREEIATRNSLAPSPHWTQYPFITAGIDVPSQGSWLGIANKQLYVSIVAPVIPEAKQNHSPSRGQLVLDLLKTGNYKAGNEYFNNKQELFNYNDFIILLATAQDACCWIKQKRTLKQQILKPGLTFISSHSINNSECPKYQQFYQSFFNTTQQIKPETNNWSSWKEILTNPDTIGRLYAPFNPHGFTTISSSLVGLSTTEKPVFNYCPGLPANNYTQISL